MAKYLYLKIQQDPTLGFTPEMAPAAWTYITAEDLGTGAVGAGLKYLADDLTWKAVAGGGLSDGDMGDIVVSGTGTILTIDTAAVTTTGSRWSINGPAAPTFLCYNSEYSLAATTSTRNANNISYDLPAGSNATSAGTTTGNMAIISGVIKPSANGTVIARFASEVAGSAITAKAGAVVYYQQTI